MSLRDRLGWPTFDDPGVPAERRHQVGLLNRWIAAMRRQKPRPARDRQSYTVVEGLLSREGPRQRVVKLE